MYFRPKHDRMFKVFGCLGRNAKNWHQKKKWEKWVKGKWALFHSSHVPRTTPLTMTCGPNFFSLSNFYPSFFTALQSTKCLQQTTKLVADAKNCKLLCSPWNVYHADNVPIILHLKYFVWFHCLNLLKTPKPQLHLLCAHVNFFLLQLLEFPFRQPGDQSRCLIYKKIEINLELFLICACVVNTNNNKLPLSS